MIKLPSRQIDSPNLILFVLCLGIFSTAIDQTVIYGALNDIMFDVRMNVFDLDAASWIVTGYLLGYTAIMLLAGRLSDVYGPQRVFILGNLVFIAASVLIAMADDFNVMIAARVLQAIGGGATVPSAIAIVANTFPGKKRPIALGFIGGSVEGGAAVGPSFGGAVSEYMGWPWIFWIDVIIGVIVIVMIYFLIKNQTGIRNPIDYAGALFIAIALSLLSLGLSQQLHRPNAEIYMVVFLVGSALFLYLFVRRLSRAINPLFQLSVFRHRVFSAANLTHLFIGGALIIALVIVPVMGYTLMELGDVEVGLRLLRLTLAIPVGAILGGFLCHRLGYRIPTIVGLLLSSIGLFFMSRWTVEIIEPWLTIHLAVCGLGFGLIISPITTAALNSVSKEDRGIASALVTWMRMAGMVIGLSLMNSWGMGHFHVKSAVISVEEIEDELPPLALSIFQDFFLAAAIVCLIAIIPAFWMKSRHSETGKPLADKSGYEYNPPI